MHQAKPLREREARVSRRGMVILGTVIVLIAVFAGAFIHPLLFLIGLSVLFVAFFADW